MPGIDFHPHKATLEAREKSEMEPHEEGMVGNVPTAAQVDAKNRRPNEAVALPRAEDVVRGTGAPKGGVIDFNLDPGYPQSGWIPRDATIDEQIVALENQINRLRARQQEEAKDGLRQRSPVVPEGRRQGVIPDRAGAPESEDEPGQHDGESGVAHRAGSSEEQKEPRRPDGGRKR